MYRESDIARIQRITVLKFVGMPLANMAKLLGGQSDLAETLRHQGGLLADKRRRVLFAIETVEKIQQCADAGQEPDWADLANFAKEVDVQSLFERGAKTSPLADARKTILERRLNWTATLGDYELARDLRAAIARGATPESPDGRTLVARWRDGIERFVGGNAELRAALNLTLADRVNWPRPGWTEQYREYFESAIKSA